MADRWVAGPDGVPPTNTDDKTAARDEGVLPTAAVEAWRTWLLTGHSGIGGDRRRLRGSHRGLKQMLVDETGEEMPHTWKHFSRAMVRLAINDALNALPKEQTHVVWLAYFGGLSNREIARRLGISVGAVQRRLKKAFEYVSEYVEHGRTAGRTAVLALLGWLSLQRWLDSWRHTTEPLNNLMISGALVTAGVTAAAIVGAATITAPRPAIEPARVATPPAAAQSPHVAASERSLAKTIRVVTAKVSGVALPLPTVPPLPLPSPPSLP